MKKRLVLDETLLVMALPIESQKRFEKAGVEVHYCGIGKINATFKATELLSQRKVKQVLNLGTAGSHKFQTHSVVECSGFVQRDMDLASVGIPLGETPMDSINGLISGEIISKYPKGICGTGDSIEVGTPKMECDLMDMEAYAIAKVCKKMDIGFYSFKYITDGSDENALSDWTSNLNVASEVLLRIYHEVMQLN